MKVFASWGSWYELLIDSESVFEVEEIESDNEEEPDGFEGMDGEQEVDERRIWRWNRPAPKLRNPMVMCRMWFWLNNFCNDTNCHFPLYPLNPHI